MTEIHYSARKLLAYAAVIALPALFAIWMLVAPGMFLAYQGRGEAFVHFVAGNVWLCGPVFAVTAFVSFHAFHLALGDRTALAFGESGVAVRTLFRRHRLGWAEVAGITFVPATTLRGATLFVRVRRDRGEKKLAIFVGLLEQKGEEIARLLHDPVRIRAEIDARGD